MTREEAHERLTQARQAWDAALGAHLSAPPAPGYADRLHALADAAEKQSAAFRLAHREKLRWRPVPRAAANLEPPPELRADFNRTGPPEIWTRFDETVPELGRALQGISVMRIAHAFEQLSECLHELADANRELAATHADQQTDLAARGIAG